MLVPDAPSGKGVAGTDHRDHREGIRPRRRPQRRSDTPHDAAHATAPDTAPGATPGTTHGTAHGTQRPSGVSPSRSIAFPRTIRSTTSGARWPIWASPTSFDRGQVESECG